MIRVAIGQRADGSLRIFEMSWISALALRNELDREMTFEDIRFRDTLAACFRREEERRRRKEWKQFVSFWAPEG